MCEPLVHLKKCIECDFHTVTMINVLDKNGIVFHFENFHSSNCTITGEAT